MAIATVRIVVPQLRLATASAEFATKVSGAQFAAWSQGANDFEENITNAVSISNQPDTFNQFATQTNTVFVAALQPGEFAVLQESPVVKRWGYTNTLNFSDGIVISGGDVSRGALLVEGQDSEVLFDSSVDWDSTETTQVLKGGARFDVSDTIIVFYTDNPNAPLRDWNSLRSNVAPFVAGGFDNDAIQSVDDTRFSITTGAGSLLTAANLNASPPTQAFQIWAG